MAKSHVHIKTIPFVLFDPPHVDVFLHASSRPVPASSSPPCVQPTNRRRPCFPLCSNRRCLAPPRRINELLSGPWMVMRMSNREMRTAGAQGDNSAAKGLKSKRRTTIQLWTASNRINDLFLTSSFPFTTGNLDLTDCGKPCRLSFSLIRPSDLVRSFSL